MNSDPFLMTNDAAKILKKSADRVRDLESSGKLPALRTLSGQRLFRREDVERLAAQLANPQ